MQINDVIRRSGDLIFFPKSNILCDLQSHTPQICIYVLIIHTEDKSFLDYDSWSKKSLKKMYINWSHDAQMTSSIIVPQKCHHGYFEVVQLCAKFSWLIKKLLSWILWRYIFICSDGHYVNIYATQPNYRTPPEIGQRCSIWHVAWGELLLFYF